MDPTQTIDNKYDSAKYTMPPAALARDIISMEGRMVPVAPALCMDPEIDGTNTPSYESHENISVAKVHGFLCKIIKGFIDNKYFVNKVDQSEL